MEDEMRRVGPGLLVASGYISAVGGVLERGLAQLARPNIAKDLPDELVAAVADLSKAQVRANAVLSAVIEKALES